MCLLDKDSGASWRNSNLSFALFIRTSPSRLYIHVPLPILVWLSRTCFSRFSEDSMSSSVGEPGMHACIDRFTGAGQHFS